MNTKACPDCLSEIPETAEVCRVCRQRIGGKDCPDCGERARSVARKCPWCGHNFARGERVASFEAFTASAAFLPTVLLRGRLIPQQIQLSPAKILITTWGFFWLSRTDEEIPWEKIAGYHYHSGWFWDSVEIQTRGQKANSIGCLRKQSGQLIKEILESMKE